MKRASSKKQDKGETPPKKLILPIGSEADKEQDLKRQELLKVSDDGEEASEAAASKPNIELTNKAAAKELTAPTVPAITLSELPEDMFTGQNTIGSYLSNKDKYELRRVNLTLHGFFDSSLKSEITSKVVLLTSHGERDKIKELFEISPAYISYLIARSDVKDWSGREFSNISAFQYALWADDGYTLDMMLKALDEADALAIPKLERDAIPEEIKRKKPYKGSITKEKIAAIRFELFEQYKEVVDMGLDYTITRYQRVLDVTTGKYQLIDPRIVEVHGETLFDLKGIEFCLMRKGEQFTPEKGKLYVRIEDGTLHYQVIALFGAKVNGSIELADLKCPLVQLDNPDQLKHYIYKILKITAEKDHTHPQALMSALKTYYYALHNSYDYPNNCNLSFGVEQWCGGIGMAEREIPTVIAQELCREDLMCSDSSHDIFNKEVRFPSTLQIFNYVSRCREPWFPLSVVNQLGVAFGITPKLRSSWPHREPAAHDGSGRQGYGALHMSDLQIKKLLDILADLCSVRAIERVSLRAKLDPANQTNLIVDQKPKPGIA